MILKKYFVIFLFILENQSLANQISINEILNNEKYHNRPNTSSYTYTLILLEKDTNPRIRYFKRFSRLFKDEYRNILFFKKPEDYKDMSILIHDPDLDGLSSDTWIYLPESKRIKRIVDSNKSQSFVGSDINYAELAGFDYEDWQHTLKSKDEACNEDKRCWIIESEPRKEIRRTVINKTGYKNFQSWIQKDNFVLVKRVGQLKKSGETKVFQIEKLEKIDGLWHYSQAKVSTFYMGKPKSTTVVRVSDMKYGINVESQLFTQLKMKKGI